MPSPGRIPPILWRLECAWEMEPDRSLVGLLTKLGGGRLPDDRTLTRALARYARGRDAD